MHANVTQSESIFVKFKYILFFFYTIKHLINLVRIRKLAVCYWKNTHVAESLHVGLNFQDALRKKNNNKALSRCSNSMDNSNFKSFLWLRDKLKTLVLMCILSENVD